MGKYEKKKEVKDKYHRLENWSVPTCEKFKSERSKIIMGITVYFVRYLSPVCCIPCNVLFCFSVVDPFISSVWIRQTQSSVSDVAYLVIVRNCVRMPGEVIMLP